MSKSNSVKMSKSSTTAMEMNSRTGMKYQTLSQDEKRQVIAERKRYGDTTSIATATGYDAAYVSRVISGKTENSKIVNRMYDKVRGRMKNSDKAKA